MGKNALISLNFYILFPKPHFFFFYPPPPLAGSNLQNIHPCMRLKILSSIHHSFGWNGSLDLVLLYDIQRSKTITDKLMYVPNDDTQINPFSSVNKLS